MKHALFREEAVDACRARLEGDVRLDAELAPWLITLLLVTIMAGAMTLLVLGEYPRRETVTGRLLPDGGMATLRLDQPGRVQAIHARVGEVVAAGAPLITVDRDTALGGGAPARHQILAHLREEQVQAERQLELVDAQIAERRAQLVARRDGLAEELVVLDDQVGALADRARLAEGQVATYTELAARGAAPKTEPILRKDAHLAALEALAGLRAAVARTRRSLNETHAEIDALEVEAEVSRARIKERLAALDQRLTETETRGETILRAPFDGVVGALSATLGADVAAGAVVMTLLPQDAKLRAELLVPTHAAGFLAPGQAVRLRYDAFPHQTFGVAEGQLAEMSKTAVSPVTLGLDPAQSPPVFRVMADLAAQSVTAYGNQMPLQAGMTLRADVVLERRRLWSLLLDPIRAAATR